MKTTEVGGEQGFDGGKKVNGRKRHILVDTMGNLLKVLAHAAHIGERAGAEKLLLKVPDKLWTGLEKILADGGYTGDDFQDWVEQTFDVEFEIALRPTDKRALSGSLFAGSSKELWLGWVAFALSAKITKS